MGNRLARPMLLSLLDGRALPAGELAFSANVAPQTASGHLARLVEGGLLSVENQGRHRYYRLAGPDVGTALEGARWFSSISAGAGSRTRRGQSFARCENMLQPSGRQIGSGHQRPRCSAGDCWNLSLKSSVS